VGTVVGTICGWTVNTGYRLTYTLTGAGPNAYAPFPFRIVDVAGGSGCGRIETTNVAVIDINEAFDRYYATVTVTVSEGWRVPLQAGARVGGYRCC